MHHEPKNGRGNDGLEDQIKNHASFFGGQDFLIQADEQKAEGGDPGERGHGNGGHKYHRGLNVICFANYFKVGLTGGANECEFFTNLLIVNSICVIRKLVKDWLLVRT